MPDLLLHIGHHKTGSTFIQNTLRANQDVLSDRGVIYPDRGNNPRKNPFTGVAAGNAKDFLKSKNSVAGKLANLQSPVRQNLLLSSEGLLGEMCRHDNLDFLANAATDLGYDRIRVLLFIRNPIGNAVSVWQQDIKTGSTSTIEESFSTFSQPDVVANFFDMVTPTDFLEVTVRNYSRCTEPIIDAVAAWLDIPRDVLTKLPVTKVNRSLSQGELALKLALNRVLGTNCSFYIKAINERLSELEVGETRPSLEAQRELVERLQPAMDRVNARIPAEAHYQPDYAEPRPLADSFEFTSAQLEVVAESLGGEILRLRRSRDAPPSKLWAKRFSDALLKGVRRGVGRGRFEA